MNTRAYSVRLALLTCAAGALVPVTSAVALHATGSNSAAPAAATAKTVTSALTAKALTTKLTGASTAATRTTGAVKAPTLNTTGTTATKHVAAPAAAGDQKPVIVGPLLDLFRFGAGIGAPLVCQAGTSAIGSGAAYGNLGTQAAPVIEAINSGCDTFATQGVAAVNMFADASKPLNALNPTVNPMIEAAARAAEVYGQQYAREISPLGPTVQGSGATIRHFEGR